MAARLVQAHLALIAAEGEGIRGLMGPWCQHLTDCKSRSAVGPGEPPILMAYCRDVRGKATDSGWWISPKVQAQGPKTGKAGRAACDAALLAAGIALMEADGSVRVPTPPAHQPA